MADAYLKLNIYPLSGLSFNWAEYISKSGATSDASLGNDGTSVSMCILVYWHELKEAIPQLVGYTKRVVVDDTGFLERHLPWRHPYYENMWCQRIASIKPWAWRNKEQGIYGPYSAYEVMILTLQFWRPPYSVLDDVVALGQEWIRYTDKFWRPSVQMLSRQGMSFKFTAGRPSGQLFPGSVGQKMGKAKLSRTWYQLPEQSVYDDNGFPARLFTDPDTGIPVIGTVNDAQFFGMPAQTLLYESVDITPRPLPFPSTLIGVDPVMAELYPLQFDVTFHFEYFNPTPGFQNDGVTRITQRGHNLMPWSGDGLWYPVASQGYQGFGGGRQPFQTSTFTDLWTPL